MLLLAFFLGLGLLLYPPMSDYWNALHQSRTVEAYAKEVAGLDGQAYRQLWSDAKDYNQHLAEKENPFSRTEEEKEAYDSLLNLSENGVLAQIEIPKLACSLPVYHGVSDEVLQIAIGHLEWSSLPTGGENTHVVLSGHRGLPHARLFTGLEKLMLGDIFLLQVLDEVLTYEVDTIAIVRPEEVESLRVQDGMDLCTLVTCTPYGVNTHRLLVRGHRVETQNKTHSLRITGDAVQIAPNLAAVFLAIPLLCVWVVLVWVTPEKDRKEQEK